MGENCKMSQEANNGGEKWGLVVNGVDKPVLGTDSDIPISYGLLPQNVGHWPLRA